jgi:hypothetical protein
VSLIKHRSPNLVAAHLCGKRCIRKIRISRTRLSESSGVWIMKWADCSSTGSWFIQRWKSWLWISSTPAFLSGGNASIGVSSANTYRPCPCPPYLRVLMTFNAGGYKQSARVMNLRYRLNRLRWFRHRLGFNRPARNKVQRTWTRMASKSTE